MADLARRANLMRRHVVEMSHASQGRHQGVTLSLAEIMVVLYFHTLRPDPTRPDRPGRDRLVASKGHGCLALYSALAECGSFSTSEPPRSGRPGSILQGHPDLRKAPGPVVVMSAGCLGHGLSVGVDMALGARSDMAHHRV
jgi:transketolase